MPSLEALKVKIFADGADLEGMLELARNPLVAGFTTNPSLMRAAGVERYEDFARQVLDAIPDMPISFEVLSDEFDQMERQARRLATWGKNVYVKIPVTNSRGEPSYPLIDRLSHDGIHVNATAIFLPEQVKGVADAVAGGAACCVSVFAGRIADTGVDPVPLMKESASILASRPNAELLWASTRELLNIFQAEESGCQIITVPHDLLGKLSLIGKDLAQYSLETVQRFSEDARAAGYEL